MIPRDVANVILKLAKGYPVITITGPRQSGKTTLAKSLFPNKTYVTLEDPDMREFAEEDPRRFLELHQTGAVFDEVQCCPNILSYLQGIVDRS